MTSQQVAAPPAETASAPAPATTSAPARAHTPATMCYQVALRPYTDIRNPPAAFIAALSEQFDRATDLARGRMCLSVPAVGPVDDLRAAVGTLLHAAAAHREATTGTAVKVEVTDVHSPGDGYCHVLVDCRTHSAAGASEAVGSARDTRAESGSEPAAEPAAESIADSAADSEIDAGLQAA
jgi:hypothetical protein